MEMGRGGPWMKDIGSGEEGLDVLALALVLAMTMAMACHCGTD